MTDFNVNDLVTGEGNHPHLFKGGKKLPGTFEGIVTAVESAEDSDVGEEVVTVKYTKLTAWQELHGETEGHHYASELRSL